MLEMIDNFVADAVDRYCRSLRPLSDGDHHSLKKGQKSEEIRAAAFSLRIYKGRLATYCTPQLIRDGSTSVGRDGYWRRSATADGCNGQR